MPRSSADQAQRRAERAASLSSVCELFDPLLSLTILPQVLQAFRNILGLDCSLCKPRRYCKTLPSKNEELGPNDWPTSQPSSWQLFRKTTGFKFPKQFQRSFPQVRFASLQLGEGDVHQVRSRAWSVPLDNFREETGLRPSSLPSHFYAHCNLNPYEVVLLHSGCESFSKTSLFSRLPQLRTRLARNWACLDLHKRQVVELQRAKTCQEPSCSHVRSLVLRQQNVLGPDYFCLDKPVPTAGDSIPQTAWEASAQNNADSRQAHHWAS